MFHTTTFVVLNGNIIRYLINNQYTIMHFGTYEVLSNILMGTD